MINRITRISGKGFMVFRKEFEFSLWKYEGKTVQIDGINKDDEKSKSNGSGKSTLLEALYWCNYGELCRKNRYKDEVIHKKEKSAFVMEEIVIDGVDYIIRRSVERKKTPVLHIWKSIDGNPQEILVNTTYQTKQDHLTHLIGMGSIEFQCSNMFGRDFMNFPELKPSERANILSEIRGLNRYLIGSKKASDLSKSLGQLIQESHGAIREKEGIMAGVRSTSFKESIDQFEVERKRFINETELNITSKEEERSRLLMELDTKKRGLVGKMEATLKEMEILSTNILNKEEITEQLSQLQQEEIEQSTAQRVLLSKTGLLQQEIDKFVKLGEGNCPYCKQSITGDYLKFRVEYHKEEMEKGKLELGEFIPIKQRISDDKKLIQEKINYIDTVQKRINNLEVNKRGLEVELSSLKSSEAETVSAIIENLKEELDGKRNEINPYITMEESRKVKIKELGKAIRSIMATIQDLENKKRYFDFWTEGFKKIRMMLFDSMIEQLESLSQEFLSKYSSELNIVMTTERETRSGTIKDEFHVSIVDSNGDEISYEMYSGGERQKIRLSISRALAQFIKDGCGKDFNFIAFDEPNDALDDIGKETNFDTFQELSEMEGKAVLVTDHDANFKDKFDYNIVVEKSNGESIIYA